MLSLTAVQRQHLKARAHSLNPSVMIGAAGLTAAVLEEIARTLESREIVKIRILEGDREMRDTMLHQICNQLNAAPVQHIGKILVIYKPGEQTPEKKPAPRKGKPLTKKQLGARSS